MINLKTAALRFVRATDNLRLAPDGVGREEAVAEAARVLEQAARDFASDEAEVLYERWYRGLPAPTEYESGREDGHDRLTEALRAGGLAQQRKEVGDE